MDHSQKIDVLIEALPYVNRFRDHIVVVKYGGHAMVNNDLKQTILYDILLMKSVGILPIIVHGGGPAISTMLDRFDIDSEFIHGVRVTSQEAMDVVEMVLCGQVNNEIVRSFNHIGGRGVGLSGVDDGLLKVGPMNTDVDYGYVGEIESIDVTLIRQLIDQDFVPIISSVGMGQDSHAYNINADYVAAAIAGAIQAHKFMLLTDVAGVLADKNDDQSLISSLDAEEAHHLIEEGIIYGGMVPKVSCCLQAIEEGVQAAHIVDGRLKHSILLELFFDMGIGTMIIKE